MWERICAHPKGGSQALLLRCSQVKMNPEENEEETTATTLGSPKGCGTKTQQQVK